MSLRPFSLHGWLVRSDDDRSKHVRRKVDQQAGYAAFQGVDWTARRQMRRIAERLGAEGYQCDLYGNQGKPTTTLTVWAPGATEKVSARCRADSDAGNAADPPHASTSTAQ